MFLLSNKGVVFQPIHFSPLNTLYIHYLVYYKYKEFAFILYLFLIQTKWGHKGNLYQIWLKWLYPIAILLIIIAFLVPTFNTRTMPEAIKDF
jgi:hypothetical protein